MMVTTIRPPGYSSSPPVSSLSETAAISDADTARTAHSPELGTSRSAPIRHGAWRWPVLEAKRAKRNQFRNLHQYRHSAHLCDLHDLSTQVGELTDLNRHSWGTTSGTAR